MRASGIEECLLYRVKFSLQLKKKYLKNMLYYNINSTSLSTGYLKGTNFMNFMTKNSDEFRVDKTNLIEVSFSFVFNLIFCKF